MFTTQGRLSHVVCPAHRDGACEAARTTCPFSHELAAAPQSSKSAQLAPTAEKAAALSKNGLGKRPLDASPAATGSAAKKSRPEQQRPAESSTMALAPTLSLKDHLQSSRILLPARQATLKAFYNGFSTLYAPFINSGNAPLAAAGKALAAEHALAQELEIFKVSNEHSYKNSARSALVGVSGREKAKIRKAAEECALLEPSQMRRKLEACTETGTQSDAGRKRKQAENRQKGRITLQRLKELSFVCPQSALELWGYVTAIPEEWGPGGHKPACIGEEHACNRCGRSFLVEQVDEQPSKDADMVCRYHHGRKRPDQVGKKRVFAWTCCGSEASKSDVLNEQTACSASPLHVFKLSEPAQLHAQQAFVHADLSSETVGRYDLLALDCELCYTTAGMSLTQLSVVSAEGEPLLDLIVRPDVDIVDYNTRFSGLSEKDYEDGAETCTLEEAREKLLALMHKDTVLIGHSLENDLKALRLVHLNVVDTVMLFPHPRGPPYRMSLRELTGKHLGRIIQSSGAVGHTASVDAEMALELVRWKLASEPTASPFRNPISKWYGAVSSQPAATQPAAQPPPDAPKPGGLASAAAKAAVLAPSTSAIP